MEEEVRKLIHDLRETAPDAWRYLVQEYVGRETFWAVLCCVPVACGVIAACLGLRMLGRAKQGDIDVEFGGSMLVACGAVLVLLLASFAAIHAGNAMFPVISLLGR